MGGAGKEVGLKCGKDLGEREILEGGWAEPGDRVVPWGHGLEWSRAG